jgi:hypothetical protein
MSTFFNSEEGMELRSELVRMTQSDEFATRTMYSTNDKDGLTFVDKHMRYMSLYPALNRQQYISNLKLMTKIITTK